MEVSALKHRPVLRGPTPLLRLQGDDRLVALTRRGNQAAYEALVARYEARLLSFCRHMLGSREDAEDVLQEVFAAAFNALLADERAINVRPWLYRIARNRCLNHLRRTQAIGVDSMDVHLADNGTTTAERVHQREDFRQLMGDVHGLPESQRTALLLREVDALSYEQIAEAMETTVPAVKSLLVRARVALAEAAESRLLTCEEVRDELGEVAEGLKRRSPPVRRHVRACERCALFDKQLRSTNKALAAVFPVGPLLLLKKFVLTQGAAGSAAGAGAAAGGAAGGMAAGSALTAGIGAVATKAAATMAAAALVTAGAVEVDHAHHRTAPAASAHVLPIARPAAAPVALPAPRVVATTPQPTSVRAVPARGQTTTTTATAAAKPSPAASEQVGGPATPAPTATTTPPIAPTQVASDSTELPVRPATAATTPSGPAQSIAVAIVPPAAPQPAPAPPAAAPAPEPTPAAPAPAPTPTDAAPAPAPPTDPSATSAAPAAPPTTTTP